MPGLRITTGSAMPASPPALVAGQGYTATTSASAAGDAQDGSAAAAGAQQRPSSPPPPPISPITPTLRAARLAGPSGPAFPVPTSAGSSTHYTAQPSPSAITFFAANRASLTHSSQPPAAVTQAAALDAPPPPQPLDFDTNADVLALKSAISILQIQRARAAADIERLSRAKAAALQHPDAFLRDLAEGRVTTGPEAPTLFESRDSDSSQEEEEEEIEIDGDSMRGPTKGKGPARDDTGVDRAEAKKSRKQATRPRHQQPPWYNLPQRQNVVRCPPINWAQYAVVGESLEKLHNEQLTKPDPGAPVTFGSGGVYEFKGDQRQQQPGAQPPQKLVGVASPYTPGRDRLDKKPKRPKPPA